MRRAVPTTSFAIVFHLVLAAMILTAHGSKERHSEVDPRASSIAKLDDAVDVNAFDRALEQEIVPAPGGGAMIVPPHTRPVDTRDVDTHARAQAPGRIQRPMLETEFTAPERFASPTTTTIAVMPPRAVGIGLEPRARPLMLPKHDGATERPHVAAARVDKPLADALEEAARSSATPINGRAVFVVKAETKEGDCSIFAIDLVDREGDGWDDARRIAYDKLRGRKLTVPPGTKVALLSIEITSAYRVPGVDGLGGRLGENDMPELTLPDPANLGARESRVVSARIVRTTYL